ncbi:VOC family protein [Nonomuraea muscovyensis]|uniref:Catechol 2,3-dioxygenase-like lactoylglutathione lyase family enzyme n=1 Tax=Nonomuraea muscovyensis TaxID=1124761 RepID=A0A7X0C1Y9_9ACTN|nr:VOC family protein [Nonomuraea muscovyensis]MBB6347035.1 catechol 2,3-dioxygenase-like lactoylglutathione lyase family enzyme [Nonomuraea muscovyensis]
MPRPQLAGIHHVKIPVTDLPRSRSWYERVFGLTVTMEFPDGDGVVRGVAGEIAGLGDVLVALRENPGAAAGCRGFDPIGFAIQDHADVQAWAGHLDELGIAHSPVIEASIGWLLVFNDPDDLELHLYTWAAHGVDHSARPGYGRPATRPPAPVR